MVRINVHGAKLIARVDNTTAETVITGLDPNTNYGVTSDLTSVVLIGGEQLDQRTPNCLVLHFPNIHFKKFDRSKGFQ